jgi:hypothetical protein
MTWWRHTAWLSGRCSMPGSERTLLGCFAKFSQQTGKPGMQGNRQQQTLCHATMAVGCMVRLACCCWCTCLCRSLHLARVTTAG